MYFTCMYYTIFYLWKSLVVLGTVVWNNAADCVGLHVKSVGGGGFVFGDGVIRFDGNANKVLHFDECVRTTSYLLLLLAHGLCLYLHPMYSPACPLRRVGDFARYWTSKLAGFAG